MSSVVFKVNVSVNLPAADNIERAKEFGLYMMSEQALKDSNVYCPRDQGTLISSSLIHSRPHEGILIWSTPYARCLYYGIVMVDPQTGKACFPINDDSGGTRLVSRKGVKKIQSDREFNFSGNGQKMWFHKAKDIHFQEWKDVYLGAAMQYLRG